MRNLILLAALLSTATFMNCASSYNTIRPADIDYMGKSTIEDISISYRYDVLSDKLNKKYVKKEGVKNMNVVALKITNDRPNPIMLGRDFHLIQYNVPLQVQNTGSLFYQLKQRPAWYLFYLLANITFHQCEGLDCEYTSIPTGLPIALGNMFVASGANAKFKKELDEYNLINKEILPGETAFGLIGIRNANFGAIEIEMNE